MEYSDRPPKVEHAYSVSEKRHQRRALMSKRVKTVVAAGAIAASFLGVSKAIEQEQKGSYEPDSYYSGKIEIVMSDNLNLRESPKIISSPGEERENNGPNTVDWQSVVAINGVDTKDAKSVVIENPLITKGESPEGGASQGLWITFDAKVNNGMNTDEEKLYVSLSPTTNEYVKSVEPGSIVDLSHNTNLQEGLGKTTVNP